MKQLAAFLATVFVCCATFAQGLPTGVLESPNLVYMTTNPWPGQAGTSPGSWTNNFVVTESNGGGLSGGNQPAYNATTGTFMFGYTQATIAYTYALSQALKDSGMTWTGYNYKWDYINQDYTRGTLSANVSFNSNNGNGNGGVLYSKSYTLGPTTNGWTTMSGTETFTSPGLLASSLTNFKLSFTGQDDRFWAGYYGPQVRNPSLTVNYTFDSCSVNPLSSPTCPGYATAYKTQQCSANPLYAPDCPGYAQAYHDQQCSINPLYAMDCPGYRQAYHDQQCSINPLFATDCPGYQQAYFDQQCQANGLYSQSCPNYGTAYTKQNIISTTSTTSTTTSTTSTDSTTTSTTPSSANTNPVSIATTSTTTSTTSPTSVTSVTSVVSAPAPSAASPTGAMMSPAPAAPAPAPAGPGASAETRKTDSEIKSATGGPGPSPGASGNSNNNAKGRAEARAKEVAKEAGEAKTFEAQAAKQGLVVGLMGFVPGFDAYSNAMIRDINALQMARLYTKQPVDNQRVLRRMTGASDRLHDEMVDLQYQQGK